jgi:glycosyltransferase involved in cell wall biosynthesis
MPDIKNMAEEVKKVNVNVEVVFKGKLSNEEVHKYLSSNKIDVFVNVSRREGLPVSIMEAMAYGICVFATDVGGTKEIVTSSNGCLLCKDISGEALLDKLEVYCNLVENEKSDLRKNAENTWNEKFNAKENITEFFRSLL